MSAREFSTEPLAYFLTWATYGTWLPGDDRGWFKRHEGLQRPDLDKQRESKVRMAEEPCLLDQEQRHVVEWAIYDHCQYRQWSLHAVNCRSNHIHVVLTATVHPDSVRNQLKAWSTRKLKEYEHNRKQIEKCGVSALRSRWWGERCSKRFINDESALEAAILYVRDAQEWPRSDR